MEILVFQVFLFMALTLPIYIYTSLTAVALHFQHYTFRRHQHISMAIGIMLFVWLSVGQQKLGRSMSMERSLALPIFHLLERILRIHILSRLACPMAWQLLASLDS